LDNPGIIVFRALITLSTLVVIAAISAGLAILALNAWVVLTTQKALSDSIEDLPHHRVALVLGTVPRSEFLNHRIEAAAALYHAGKVDHLLVSGYREDRYYDEPGTMRAALLDAGVPESAITSDLRGFRTLDSVRRARDIYGVTSCTIVSQKFHNHRAVLIARRHGMTATALNAPDAVLGTPVRLRFREIAARCAAILDLFILPVPPPADDPPEPIQTGSTAENRSPLQR